MEKKEIWELMRSRHSVRRYLDTPIPDELRYALGEEAEAIRAESGLEFRLIYDNEEIFQAYKPHYGSFSGCRNCVALYGPKGADEKIGYYGERFVLFAQSLGLNTCWVAMSFEKKAVEKKLDGGLVLHDVLALGFGENQGKEHKSKPVTKLADIGPDTPRWFEAGMDAAMLAPTAINQQRFFIRQVSERGVKAKALLGPCSKTDLGIVKYHFELGAGKENFDWVE